jgi:acyl carrier protein
MHLKEEELVNFARSLLPDDEYIDADTELFSSALLDSIAMMSLINFVEERVGIQIPAHEVTLENFDSPVRIIAYLERRG